MTKSKDLPFVQSYSPKPLSDLVGVQLTLNNVEDVTAWVKGTGRLIGKTAEVTLPHTTITARTGDYITTEDGVNFRVWDSNVFESRYNRNS